MNTEQMHALFAKHPRPWRIHEHRWTEHWPVNRWIVDANGEDVNLWFDDTPLFGKDVGEFALLAINAYELPADSVSPGIYGTSSMERAVEELSTQMFRFEKPPTEILIDVDGKELFRWKYDFSRLFKPGQTRTDNGVHYEVVSSKADYTNCIITTVVKPA